MALVSDPPMDAVLADLSDAARLVHVQHLAPRPARQVQACDLPRVLAPPGPAALGTPAIQAPAPRPRARQTRHSSTID